MTNSDQRGGLGPSSHDAGTQDDYQARFRHAQNILATVLTPEQMNSISEEQYRQLVELQMEHGDVPIIQPEEAEAAGAPAATQQPASVGDTAGQEAQEAPATFQPGAAPVTPAPEPSQPAFAAPQTPDAASPEAS